MIKKIFRTLFSDKSQIFRLALLIYRFKYWYPKIWKIDILKKYSGIKTSLKFIQVGSNNGIIGDPLYPYIIEKLWTGVLIEPVPYLFEELKNTYKNVTSRLQFENSAIASQNGNLKFYRLQKCDLPGMPVWYDQLGSFKKEVILRHRDVIPHFDSLLIQEQVASITFEGLIKKYSIQKVDLVHIDTEGYDYEILKLIPFEQLNIELIMFEHVHLTSKEYYQAIQLLKKNDYKIGRENNDTIGIKKSLLPQLMKNKN
jgi:FkbM family methyltransferase